MEPPDDDSPESLRDWLAFVLPIALLIGSVAVIIYCCVEIVGPILRKWGGW